MNLSPGKYRLGGSAVAQCYNQLGNEAPDLDDPHLLAKAFDITQGFIRGTVWFGLNLPISFESETP